MLSFSASSPGRYLYHMRDQPIAESLFYVFRIRSITNAHQMSNVCNVNQSAVHLLLPSEFDITFSHFSSTNTHTHDYSSTVCHHLRFRSIVFEHFLSASARHSSERVLALRGRRIGLAQAWSCNTSPCNVFFYIAWLIRDRKGWRKVV